MKSTQAFFGCNQCTQRSSTNGLPWSHSTNGRSKEDFNNPDPNAVDATGIKCKPPLFDEPQFHPAVTVPLEPVQAIPGGVLKAEDQHFMLRTTTKTSSTKKGPIARGNLFDWVCKTQSTQPIPNPLLRIVNVRAMVRYKCKDYLTFFMTVMAMAIPKLPLTSHTVRDPRLYASMIAALHIFTVLYLSYNATDYVDYIHFAAHAYVRHAIAYHGPMFTSYNWHALSHAATDTRRHGPAMLRSAFGSELFFNRFRKFINCYHQQTTSLINKRYYLLNIDPVTRKLHVGRNRVGSKLHPRYKVDDSQLSSADIAAVTQQAVARHPNGIVSFYRTVNCNGFVIGINSERRLQRKVFSDAVVTRNGNFFETHLIVNVLATTENHQYLWCKKFMRMERIGIDLLPQPWCIGPIPPGMPHDLIRKFYCRGRKTTTFHLLPLSSVYCTAYSLPQQTKDTKEPVTCLIAIPIKGVQ